jgi:hypothetical protein
MAARFDVARLQSRSPAPDAAARPWPPPAYPDKRPDSIGSTESVLAAARSHLASAMAHSNPTPRQPPCAPLAFQEDFAFRPSFLGCGSTFIPAPNCSSTDRNPRLWVRNLNGVREQRARLTDAQWDPYAHFNARQAHLQFLAADLVYRKDKYARPISALEDATCFQQSLAGSIPDSGAGGCPPGPLDGPQMGAGAIPAPWDGAGMAR